MSGFSSLVKCSAAAMAAAAGLAMPVLADECRITAQAGAETMQFGQSLPVSAFATFPATGFALASASFDMMSSHSDWTQVSAGAILGDDVLGIGFSQPHDPFLGDPADPTNPIRIWSGVFSPDSAAAALVKFEPNPTDFWFYPSALTPSSVECTPDAVRDWVLVNPMTVGEVQVAPAAGTSVGFNGRDVLVGGVGADRILIGMLLPAVQKIRIETEFEPTDLTIETELPSAGDDMPLESISVNFTQATWGHTVSMNLTSGGDNCPCYISHTGILICLICDAQNGDSFAVERLPNTQRTWIEVDGSTGHSIVMTELGFDEPAEVRFAGNAPVMTRSVRIRTSGNNLKQLGLGCHVIEATNAGLLTLSFENVCSADISGSADPFDSGYGVPDGVLDASDFFFYLDQFVAGQEAIADLTGSSDPNHATYGEPDGQINASDFFFYLDLFAAGCP